MIFRDEPSYMDSKITDAEDKNPGWLECALLIFGHDGLDLRLFSEWGADYAAAAIYCLLTSMK
jgi:hypothetical protein